MAIVGPSHRGISFAIPSNKARMIYEKIKANGAVARGWIGVQLQAVPVGMRGNLPRGGVLLTAILEGSTAAKSGLQKGDIVIAFNGEMILSPRSFSQRVQATPPGTVVMMEILRGEQRQTLPVTVTRKPMSP